ncbi:MAG: hypothetical protein J6U54_07530, partial [Clostridiales bacterium]|nr:hypothetical protein [Clostridiales bacterium]
VCFWEDDCYILYNKKDENGRIVSLYWENNCDDEDYDGEDVIDIPSGANNKLTLRQGRANYKEFGACTLEMLEHCREPMKEEME